MKTKIFFTSIMFTWLHNLCEVMTAQSDQHFRSNRYSRQDQMYWYHALLSCQQATKGIYHRYQ